MSPELELPQPYSGTITGFTNVEVEVADTLYRIPLKVTFGSTSAEISIAPAPHLQALVVQDGRASEVIQVNPSDYNDQLVQRTDDLRSRLALQKSEVLHLAHDTIQSRVLNAGGYAPGKTIEARAFGDQSKTRYMKVRYEDGSYILAYFDALHDYNVPDPTLRRVSTLVLGTESGSSRAKTIRYFLRPDDTIVPYFADTTTNRTHFSQPLADESGMAALQLLQSGISAWRQLDTTIHCNLVLPEHRLTPATYYRLGEAAAKKASDIQNALLQQQPHKSGQIYVESMRTHVAVSDLEQDLRIT